MARMAGTILLIGASDRGKSTLARWLVEKLLQREQKVGWLDGDIGQSTLGVSRTMNLAVRDQRLVGETPRPQGTFFVGSTSPRGHMLPTLVGVELLRGVAVEEGAGAIVIDTTGLVAEEAGGGSLKRWKIELLRPGAIIALHRNGELEHILAPLRRDSRFALHELIVDKDIPVRSAEERMGRRLFRRYFEEARFLSVDRNRLPVYESAGTRPGRLLAFQDARGLSLGLGTVVVEVGACLQILTPLVDLSSVASVRLGSVRLDPATGEEFQ